MSARATMALVIPAWNAERFLPALFECVHGQCEPFDEVVLCDDASTDDTAALARSLGARVVQHARNAGCSAAKNTALAAVESEWVHFHDADDLMDAGFARAAREAAGPHVDAWIPRWRHVDATTGECLGRSEVDARQLATDAVAANLTTTINNVGVYRCATVRALGGFRGAPEVLHNEDRAFHLALAEAGARFVAGNQILVETRRTAGSMSQSNAARCLSAHGQITCGYVHRNPGRHRRECAIALWQAATGLASLRQFTEADALVDLAAALGFPSDPVGSARFRMLCMLGPRRALRVREWGIRAFKPGLRRA